MALFTAMVYLISLPGGWLADNILGQRKAVLYGGILIALGYYAMVLHGLTSFYIALSLVALGTGLLKPNVSTIVGGLYPENDHRRDAGFSIFYMGINVGALISPLACGTVAKLTNWHYGFGLAGVGMTLGLIQFVLGQKHLQDAGLQPPPNPVARRHAWLGAAVIVGLFAVVMGLSAASRDSRLAGRALQCPGSFSDIGGNRRIRAGSCLDKRWTSIERKRLGAILVLFVASALFWSAFEQAGSTLSLFADRNTRLSLLGLGFPGKLLPVRELDLSWFYWLRSLRPCG